MKYLIVGLGNMGPDYEGTRHNAGFDVVEYLAEKKGVSFEQGRLGDLARIKHKGRTLILLKPSTFMNRSGKAVQYWGTKEKINPENLLILTDDLNLPFGKLRLKGKGKAGGHNGIQDIIDTLGTSQFARLRIGIGDDFHKGQQVDYVLGKWSEEEKEKLPAILKKAAGGVLSYCTIGLGRTMNTLN